MNDQKSALERVLEPGEQIIWCESPDVGRLTWPSFIIYIFAIPWTVFTLGWLWLTTDGLRWLPPAVGIYPWWTPRFYLFSSIVVCLPGIAMLTAPFWAWRKARRTLYAVTNRRVLHVDTARPAKARSLQFADHLTVRVKPDEDAAPHEVEFGNTNSKEGLLLKAVRNPEQMLRELQKSGLGAAA